MEEPSVRKSRLALAGGVAAIIAVGATGFLIGRSTSSRNTTSPAVVRAIPAKSVKLEPAPSPSRDSTLERADLLALAAQAADAFASGMPAPPSNADVAGKRFELRLPFGCQGPADAESNAAMRWRYDDEAKALRVHVAPVVWSKGDWAPTAQPSAAEPVRGFWIARPWTASEICPASEANATPTGAEPVTLAGQTLAIAEYPEATDVSNDRRDLVFETVLRVSRDEVQADHGLQLHLTGRISANAGQGSIRCRQPGGSEQRPICVVAVDFEQATVENPRTGKALAVWDLSKASKAAR